MTPLERKQVRKLRSLVRNESGSEERALEAKQAVVHALKAAHRKFKKLAGMNRLIDGGEAGVAKAKRKMNNNWTKRQSNNVVGFYDPKKARVQHGV